MHVNCRYNQYDIADDNRMMHRQIIRLLNLKFSDLHFDLRLWSRQWPYLEGLNSYSMYQGSTDPAVRAMQDLLSVPISYNPLKDW